MQQSILVDLSACVCVDTESLKDYTHVLTCLCRGNWEETIVSLKSSHVPDSNQNLIMFLALS